MTKQSLLLTLGLCCAVNLLAQSKLTFEPDSLTRLLYQHASEDSPGLAVGMVHDGSMVYEHYLGLANLEHAVAVDERTRFNIASNAKQFTALCILQLAEQGKLQLEEDLRTYLPEMLPDIPEKISLSHLIAHSSGIRDIHHLWALQGKTWWKLFVDNEDAMELLQKQRDLNFPPGTDYLYSNSNYILLAEIVSRVTGEDFSEYARRLFEALDMPNTHFLTNYQAVIPHKSRPYANWNGWREYPAITEIHGDGGLFTTLRDQLKWEEILQHNDGRYLSRELIDQSQELIAFEHGYGLELKERQGLPYTFHDGSTGAYHATFLRFPTKQLSLVVMTNNGSVPTNYLAWQIATEVLELEAQESNQTNQSYPGEPDQVEALAEIQEVLGVYKGDGEDGTVIRITEKDGSLYREIYQRDPVRLINEREGLFEYETIQGLKMNFTHIGQEDQRFTLYKSTQAPSTYHKLADLDLNQFDKSELNGRFYNEETDTEIMLKYGEGDTYVLTKNGREISAKLILADHLRMMSNYQIRVTRDPEGQVSGLKVDNDRIRNVVFEKRP